MKFEPSRAKAIDKLNNFVEKNLSDYSKAKKTRLWAYLLKKLLIILIKRNNEKKIRYNWQSY